jgi:hypothetical protein
VSTCAKIDVVEAHYRQGGLNFAERRDLNRRLDQGSFEPRRDMRRRGGQPPRIAKSQPRRGRLWRC